MAHKIRLSLDVNPEMNDILESLCAMTGETKSQVIRKAIALYRAIANHRAKGDRVAAVDDKGKVKTVFVGL